MDYSSVYIYLSDISAFSVLLPLSVGLYFYRSSDRVIKIFYWFIVNAFLSEGIGFYLSKLQVNNLPMLHVYTVIEFTLLMMFYYPLSSGTMQKVISGIIIGFVGFALLFAFVISDFWHFNTISRTIEAFIFTVAGLLFFYSMLKKESNLKLEKNPLFWINTGILLYFMGNFFLFMLNSFLQTKASFQTYWTLHSVLNILKNVLFTIGLTCSKQVQK